MKLISLYDKTNQIKKKVHTPNNYYGFYVNEKFVSPESIDDKYLLKEDSIDCSTWKYSPRIFLYKETLGRAMYASYLINLGKDYSKVVPYLLSCRIIYFQKTD